MECYTCLRNVTDLLSDGKTPYERRFGQPFKGPIIPFGSLVEYHPITGKDQSIIHQFGKKVLPGLFLGHAFTREEFGRVTFVIFTVSSTRPQIHCLIRRSTSVIRMVFPHFGSVKSAHHVHLSFDSVAFTLSDFRTTLECQILCTCLLCTSHSACQKKKKATHTHLLPKKKNNEEVRGNSSQGLPEWLGEFEDNPVMKVFQNTESVPDLPMNYLQSHE